LKPALEDLWRSPDLSLEMTRPKELPALPRICACASRRDAMYYACGHNSKGDHTASVLIEFNADLEDVVIDGRDLLFTMMQLGNPTSSREALDRVFEPAVLRYADRAWATSEQRARIACCDLASQDPTVTRAHALNELVIGGRYFTRISSAFMVKAPIPAASIVSVERVNCRAYVLPDIDIELNRSLGR
jgi:hypothetical protein